MRSRRSATSSVSASSTTSTGSSSSGSSSSSSSDSSSEEQSSVSTRSRTKSRDSSQESDAGKRSPKRKAPASASAPSGPKKQDATATPTKKPQKTETWSKKPVQAAVKKPVPRIAKKEPRNLLKKAEKGKVLKEKSIFSPDNSSESDSGIKEQVKQSKTPPPVFARKSAPPPTHKSASSTSDETERDSDGERRASTPKKGSKNRTEERKGRVEQRKRAHAQMRPTARPKAAPSSEESEEEARSPTPAKKVTRSSIVRKSKLIHGSPVKKDDSNSESETEGVALTPHGKKPPVKSTVKSVPGKRGSKKGNKGQSKTKNKTPIVQEQYHPLMMEERKCPVPGCDSKGHMSGKFEKHYLPSSCPLFHHLTFEMCIREKDEREEKDKSYQKLIEQLPRKVPGRDHRTPEQRVYVEKVAEGRLEMSKKKEKAVNSERPPGDGPSLLGGRDRQPPLEGLTSDFDLKLFQEAQAAASEDLERELEGKGVFRGVQFVQIGKYEMETWYHSPYPDEVVFLPKIYLCEFCLKYLRSQNMLRRHMDKCVWRHPPGDEIYRKDKLLVWEVDGKRQKSYCQNLCLLAKLFLDHKTLYFDVEPFLFYIMTVADSHGCHITGYFSKEKNSFLNYNVSCIMTLPPYQRQGFGRLLIDFSYQLTRMEEKIGSPEKPLSDLGLISYRNYWRDAVLSYLCNFDGTSEISIKDMSSLTGVNSYDLVSTMQELGIIKYWKGKHIILRKQDLLEEHREKMEKRKGERRLIDPTCLRWRPYQAPNPPPSNS